MPVYEYLCPNCGKQEDRMVKFEDRNNQVCQCGEKTNKRISAPNLGGFDDYGRSK